MDPFHSPPDHCAGISPRAAVTAIYSVTPQMARNQSDIFSNMLYQIDRRDDGGNSRGRTTMEGISGMSLTR